jgi:hypothetical protein
MPNHADKRSGIFGKNVANGIFEGDYRIRRIKSGLVDDGVRVICSFTAFEQIVGPRHCPRVTAVPD